jgi:hypothetical protein
MKQSGCKQNNPDVSKQITCKQNNQM